MAQVQYLTEQTATTWDTIPYCVTLEVVERKRHNTQVNYIHQHHKHRCGIQLWSWWRCSSVCVPRRKQLRQISAPSVTRVFSGTSRSLLSPPDIVATSQTPVIQF